MRLRKLTATRPQSAYLLALLDRRTRRGTASGFSRIKSSCLRRGWLRPRVRGLDPEGPAVVPVVTELGRQAVGR